jgi:hypothetical protein
LSLVLPAEAGDGGLVGKDAGKRAAVSKYAWKVKQNRRKYEKGLKHINAYREAAGIGEMKLDDELSMAAQQHADYLTQNKVRLSHKQARGAPGFVGVEFFDRVKFFGGKGAAFECISTNPDFNQAVDGHMSSVYHRLPFMNPDFDRVGLGVGPRVSVADFGSGKREKDAKPVLCPADGQRKVTPFWVVNESPNPVSQFGSPPVVGYPISIRFGEQVKTVSAGLEANKSRVPFYLLDRDKDKVKQLKNEVFLIPKEPMKPLTSYTATVTVKTRKGQKAVTWSFITSSDKPPKNVKKRRK